MNVIAHVIVHVIAHVIACVIAQVFPNKVIVYLKLAPGKKCMGKMNSDVLFLAE